MGLSEQGMNDKFLLALSAVVSFLVGWNIATDVGEARMLAYKERQAEIITATQEQYAKEREDAEARYAAAITERDNRINSLAYTVRNLDSNLNRMRELAANGTNAMPKEGTDSCQSVRIELNRCKRLLIEGAELLRDGAGLLGKQSADHRALIEMVK